MPSIRNAQPSDFPSLAKLLVYTQTLHVEAFPDIYKPMSEQFAVGYIEELAGQDVRMRVAESGGVVAGYTAFEWREIPESAFAKRRLLCYLNQITVGPEFQEQGIGAQLVSDMFAIGTTRNVFRFELDVWGFNDNAKRFFTSQGFDRFGTRMACVK